MTHNHETAHPKRTTPYTHRRGLGRTIVVTSLVLVIGAVLVLWGWNTTASGLLGAPKAEFVHAFALEAALAGLMMSYFAIRAVGSSPQ